MAKKKNSHKKHTFKYATPAAGASALREPNVAASSSTPVVSAPNDIITTDGRNFSYVRRDLRRLAVFSGVLVAVEIALWLAVEQTSFGPGFYNLIKL